MDFIEARELSFSQLNETIRRAGKECRICACQGQRFIAAGMSGKTLVIDGVPGNALGAYLGGGSITVNGKAVRSGQQSDYIPINDKPKAVEIVVSNGGASTTYTIYIQRRPSEKRTRVSAGYINSIHLKGTTWKIDADLVSIQYSGDDYNSGNWSTFTNKTKEVGVYDYNVAPHCVFYYGSKDNCYRAHNVSEFMNNYLNYGSSLYTFVYIEDEIVAVFPYGADY